MKLLLIGMSHRTAPLELRERFAVDDPAPIVTKWTSEACIEEAVLLSTCNRVEAVVWTADPEAARLRLRSAFEREISTDGARPASEELDSALYTYHDAAAVRHLFRVACAIDSMVVGEPQILGQVKDSYRSAVDAGTCGPMLGRLYQRAFATAKRVRNETTISERPVSVARVAVDLARQIFETLEDKHALLVGAGEMIELALETLRREGLAAVRVANRTPARAAALAERFDASAHGLDEIPELLGRSDVVLSCIGGDTPIIEAKDVAAAIRGRRGRALFAIDIGVPRNVHPEVAELDGAYVYDLDDLQAVAESNAEERLREVEQAERIALEEQQRFEGWLGALAAVPTIRALRSRAESIRQGEIDRGLAGGDFGERERALVDSVTRAVVNKILHEPVSRLRSELDGAEGLAHLEAARALFALDEGDDPEPSTSVTDLPPSEDETP